MKKTRSGWTLDSNEIMLLNRIYKKIWDEVGERNGLAVLWFAVLQDFLENKGYEIRKKNEA